MTSNYFKIPNPDEMYCNITQFRNGVLSITAQLEEQLIHRLTFTIRYYSGPLAWRGAGFRVFMDMPPEDLKKQWKIPDNVFPLPNKYKLYVAEVDKDIDQSNTVIILATYMSAQCDI